VREWLRVLGADDRKIIGENIKGVEFSWPIGMPLCRALGNGIWEVRSALTQGRIARVLFCVHEGRGAASRIHEKEPEDAGGRACLGAQT
jgi:hypothetical protein